MLSEFGYVQVHLTVCLHLKIIMLLAEFGK